MNDNATVVAAVLAAASTAASTHDGRSNRQPPSTAFVAPTCTWDVVKHDPSYLGWFLRNLRCTYDAFWVIVHRVATSWHKVNAPVGKSPYSIADRVAVTLHYLCHGCPMSQSGAVFGLSKKGAVVAIQQVIGV